MSIFQAAFNLWAISTINNSMQGNCSSSFYGNNGQYLGTEQTNQFGSSFYGGDGRYLGNANTTQFGSSYYGSDGQYLGTGSNFNW